MNRLSCQLPVGFLLASCLVVSTAFAQDPENRILILKTQPEHTEIELTGNLAIRGDGSVEATPVDLDACSGSGGPVDCGDVEVGPPTFRVNNATSASVIAGQTVTFSWNSRGAWECKADGDLPGWNHQDLMPRSIDDGRRSFSTTGLAKPEAYNATLLCSNGPVESNGGVAQSVSLTINPLNGGDPTPEGCEGREPPSGWTRMNTGALSCVYSSGFLFNADCRFWAGGIWPQDPGSSAGQTRRLVTNRFNSQQYIAVRFNTDDLSPTEQRRITTEQGGNPLKDVRRIMTISSCPGDFDRDEILADTGCYGTIDPLFPFRYGGSQTSLGCKLESGRTYFLNIIATQSPLGTPTQDIQPHSSCGPTDLCGSVYSPRNN